MSDKENNVYYQCRKKMGLTREKAAELLEVLSEDRIERIENGKAYANPYEVTVMAEKYKAAHLCNYYCANECEIGKIYVPEVKTKELSQITLETLASLNSIVQKKDRLIEITVDGKITGDELRDFVIIKNELDKISQTIDSLKLWVAHMKASGAIDEQEYERIKNELKNGNY